MLNKIVIASLKSKQIEKIPSGTNSIGILVTHGVLGK